MFLYLYSCNIISCIKSFLLYIPVLVQAPYNRAIACFPLSLSLPFFEACNSSYVQTHVHKYKHKGACKQTGGKYIYT